MESRITKIDVPECDIEVGLSVSPSAMTRVMRRGATQPRTAAVGA
jgi:hypothetical protein